MRESGRAERDRTVCAGDNEKKLKMDMDIPKTVQALVVPGKGVLAADESSGTIEKRFKSICVTGIEVDKGVEAAGEKQA